ncbi:MAG: alpha/beta fold hydrolase [Solirubrobacterales bacterium]
MARFVLVHGAFAGGWIWGPLAERLEAAGHEVEAPDLPGMGEDTTPVEEVTLAAYADRVCEVLDASPEQSILVGNSMGGVVMTEAAARRPEKVKRLIYVAAFMPADGQSLVQLTELPEGEGDLVQATVVVSGEPPVGVLPEASLREGNLACPADVLEWAVESAGPQPVVPFTEPVSLNDDFERIPRSYVISTRDRFIPPPLQRRMVKDRNVTDVVELDTDHHPQLSRPDELAAALDERAREGVAA